jgi:hypothetical protein
MPPRPSSAKIVYFPAKVVPLANVFRLVGLVIVFAARISPEGKSSVPQLAQKRDASGLSVRHLAHFMALSLQIYLAKE